VNKTPTKEYQVHNDIKARVHNNRNRIQCYPKLWKRRASEMAQCFLL